jgi:hypothetical protein
MIPTQRSAIRDAGRCQVAGRFVVHPTQDVCLPRPPRLDLAGVAHRVVQRSNGRQPYFFTTDDDRRYVRDLNEIVRQESLL